MPHVGHVHVICEMGQVLELWHHQHILTMANHTAFLKRYWPISNGHRYCQPQRRHHSGQRKDPHSGDVHQCLLVAKNSGRSAIALKWCWNFRVNFELLHFSFKTCMLHLRAGKKWAIWILKLCNFQAIQCDQASASVGDTFCKATR